MQIKILGCGSSSGVPIIGCQCMRCRSLNPKNIRTRSSILITKSNLNILIDTTPDLRQQLLINKITTIDAIIFTHSHSDHVNGIDDLRPIFYKVNRSIPIYATKNTIDYLKLSFSHLFIGNIPILIAHEVDFYQQISIKGLTFDFFLQSHAKAAVLGIKLNNFVYSTDVNEFPVQSECYLHKLDLWIVDCLSYYRSKSHANLDLVLNWVANYKPKKTILTHLNHDLDYNELTKSLPENIDLAFDGMELLLE